MHVSNILFYTCFGKFRQNWQHCCKMFQVFGIMMKNSNIFWRRIHVYIQFNTQISCQFSIANIMYNSDYTLKNVCLQQHVVGGGEEKITYVHILVSIKANSYMYMLCILHFILFLISYVIFYLSVSFLFFICSEYDPSPNLRHYA